MKAISILRAPASVRKDTTSLYQAMLAVVVFCMALWMPSIGHAAGYNTQAGRIYDGRGQEIQIRGINHYGFNALVLQPEYLWEMGWKEQIAQIKSLGFNAVRLPFVPDTLYNNTPINQLSYVNASLNADLIGKTPLEVLDMWMAEADAQGLYIMMDFHSVSMQRQYPTWFVSNPADFNLMYNKQAYTPADWMRDLSFVAKRYANLSHFFAIDIYNEPNGKVRWNPGDPNMTDSNFYWKPAVEAASSAILSANPNLLIFVQGITANYDGIENTNIGMNWGENFQAEAYQPLNVPNDKLVLTPHTYGPDVFEKTSFSDSSFPSNLSKDWDALFGQFFQTHAVVIGEWGGHYGQGGVGQRDIQWQNALVDYLVSKGVRNSFYWCYTPNSFDTGGVLDDSLKVRQDKMAMLKRLWGDAPAATDPPPPVQASATTPAPVAAPSTPTPSTPAPVAAPTTAAPVTAPATQTTASATAIPAAVENSVSAAPASSSGGGPIDSALLALLGAVFFYRFFKTSGFKFATRRI